MNSGVLNKQRDGISIIWAEFMTDHKKIYNHEKISLMLLVGKKLFSSIKRFSFDEIRACSL